MNINGLRKKEMTNDLSHLSTYSRNVFKAHAHIFQAEFLISGPNLVALSYDSQS